MSRRRRDRDPREMTLRLCKKTPAERARFVDKMNHETRLYYDRCWADWAQIGQAPPVGDWRVWMIMAGRGFGKTRAGAEWVRGLAEQRRAYLRRGREVELKSFVGTTGVDGGYAVPREIDALIDATLKSVSPIRQIANVVSVGTSGYRKLVTSGGTPSGWVAETAGRPETDTPDFHEIAPPMGELYANPAASQAMLDDAAFDVEAWLGQEIATEFARAEGAAFVGGNGTNKPLGFLTGTPSSAGDGSRTFGTLQYVASGAAGNFAASNPQDRLIDLIQSLRSPYRQGASFVMNSSTLARIRKFKTADGAFLWQASLVNGQPDTLLGYPVVEAEDMPDVAADSLSIAFGNFKAGYLIAERRETTILRDPFSNKPFVHFYATALIDIAANPVVEAIGVDTPPPSPAIGQCWIVGDSPAGAWAGAAGAIAGWTGGGWRFVRPFDALAVWNAASGVIARYGGGSWSTEAAVSDPAGGATVDSEVRATVAAMLAALRNHGLIAR